MNLSNSGRIVLIDDNIDEARPLISTLGVEGIPYVYYDGKLEGLPTSPLEGTRFIFLDIELHGMQGQDDKTKASALVARLRKIISTTNGPYAIIFWTKHSEIIDQIIDNCSKALISPIAWLDLEKQQCLDDNGGYDLKKIFDGLHEKLKKIGAFSLYVEWENILHLASKKFIKDFSKLIPDGEKWSATTSTLFYNLYKAYVERNELQDITEQFKCSCKLLNRSFLDTLQGYSDKNLKLPDGFKLISGPIDATIRSKLNSYLLFNNSFLSRPMTGYVYKETNDNVKNLLIENIIKPDQKIDGIELCKIIITPSCDLAQNKIIKDKCSPEGKKVHRIVYGLLLPFDVDLKRKEKTEAMFDITPFWHEEKSWIIILHFSAITFQHEDQLQLPVFCLSQDLIFDIQSKAANNLNRLGNFQLK
jgi:hypothetical protein